MLHGMLTAKAFPKAAALRYSSRVQTVFRRNMASTGLPIRALVPIANGSEELEATTIIDTLRRAKFVVDVAAVGPSLQVETAHKMKITADMSIDDVPFDGYDVIALPGGMPGAEHLRDCAKLKAMLLGQRDAGRWVTAICASPAVVLVTHGILNERIPATCFAASKFVDKMPNKDHIEERVVAVPSEKIITSRGPGTAIEFALSIVEHVAGKDAADKVQGPMLARR